MIEDQDGETSISWLKSLRRSLEVNQSDPHHRFVQLATVTKQGELAIVPWSIEVDERARSGSAIGAAQRQMS